MFLSRFTPGVAAQLEKKRTGPSQADVEAVKVHILIFFFYLKNVVTECTKCLHPFVIQGMTCVSILAFFSSLPCQDEVYSEA